MRTFIIALQAFLLFVTSVSAQECLRCISWNVENLTDTIDNPLTADDEFTPQGSRHWDAARYWAKLGRVAKTITAMSGIEPCMLVGLCEVENDSVVSNLVNDTYLGRLGYEYIITHADDPRGMNVALLYHPLLFTPISHDTLRIPTLRTRDILHVSGTVIANAEQWDVFVVHMPSQRGGRKQSEPRRRLAAETLCHAADSVQAVRRGAGVTPHILIMGDFNAEPKSFVFRETLADYSLLTAKHEGTYKYKGIWGQLDHFLVNEGLLPQVKTCRNYAPDFLLKGEGEKATPFRTYLGTYYQGGISDHLPVILDVKIQP